MMNMRFSILFVLYLFACSSPEIDPAPDARSATLAVDPAGRYTLHTSWTVEPPPQVAAVLAKLSAATDGPDDPSRYLIDHLVDRMDDGWTKALARTLTPLLAAYVNERVAMIAP